MPTSTRSRRTGPTKGDLKEQAILETAERLFAERPVAEISVDELARGAGISRPSFYFYFGSKEDVLMTVAERVASELEEEVAERLAGITDDPRAAITAAIEAVADQWRKHGPLLRAAIEAWGSVPPVRKTWEGVMAGFVAGSTAIVESERGRGTAGPGPEARALVTALTWMNERCFYTTFGGIDPSLSEDELVPTLTEVWMRAIYGRGEADRPL
jgi:TetR/AcrR family transcriptional regulator, ethionamide resistance regulator